MIETNRLKMYATSKEQMEVFIAAQSVDVLESGIYGNAERCIDASWQVGMVCHLDD